MTGYVTYKFQDGDSYTGCLKNGKRNGHGTHTFASGVSYTGNFVNNYIIGQGTMQYSDGTKKPDIGGTLGSILTELTDELKQITKKKKYQIK